MRKQASLSGLIKTKLKRRFEKIEQKFARLQGKGFLKDDPRNEVSLLRELLGSNPLVGVDVGGNRGDYAAALRSEFPNMEIHVFEPSSTNLKKLFDRFSSDDKVKILNKALSDSEGQATLHADAPGSGLGSLIKRRLDHFNIGFGVQESVQTIRFEDYWIRQLDRCSLDLVKFDIEGHELPALYGMGHALESTRLVQFEFGGCNIDTRTFFQDFWYFFAERDFDVYRMSPLGLIKIDRYKESLEFFSTTNYLACNRKISD